MTSEAKLPASLQPLREAGSTVKATLTNTPVTNSEPLIPLSVVDAPSQRVYIASAFIAIQTYKLYSFSASIWTNDDFALLGTFLLLDLLFVVAVSRLRTPRFDYTRSRWIIIFALLASSDWIITGGWRVILSITINIPVLGWLANTFINSWSDTFNRQVSISEHRVRLRDIIRPSHHILGQHTIHVLPYSTAAFSTSAKGTPAIPACFCLDTDNSKSELSIPILFNNTEPQFLSYSISPLGSYLEEEKTVYNITISKNSLIRLGGQRKESIDGVEDPLDLELNDADDEAEEEEAQKLAIVRRGESQALSTGNRNGNGRALPGGKKSGGQEVMYHLPIKQAGRIRLERVLDRNHFDARLSKSEILIVECPKMGFNPRLLSSTQSHGKDFCPGDAATMDVWVKGFAPLKLDYSRYVESQSGRGNNDKKTFSISHISEPDLNQSSEEDQASELAVALKGAKPRNKQLQHLAQASSRNITLPITIDTSKEGKRIYHLESVRDACGNAFEPDERALKYFEDIYIHARPTVVFERCSADHPIDLLKGGPSREVTVRIDGVESEDGPFITELQFEGENESWTKNVTMNKRSSITIDKPGTYNLNRVSGRFCSGESGAQWTCPARVVPPPTASIQFDAIQDPCSGPVGVKALAVLTGSPPFRVKYRVEREGKPAREYEQIIKRTREEIEFRPSAEGEVTYTFTGLSDSNYQHIDLSGPSFTQVLHPVASASFQGGSQAGVGPTVSLQSCQGNIAKAKISMEGVGPFELNYAIRSGGGELIGKRKVKNIKENTYELEVEVPKQIAEKGGSLIVALDNIKDSKGCERPLTAPDLTINVHRTKPSVSFVDPRRSDMLEGKAIDLPIRLAGEGPWTVKYRHKEKGGKPVEVKFDKSDSILSILEPGTYEILDVHDHHCPGVVLKSRETHVVTVKARPTAKFDEQGLIKVKADILSRPSVCLGTPDFVGIQVNGHFPISLSYRHVLPQNSQSNEHTFNAAQNRTSLQLDTEVEGRHVYELSQVGDAVYGMKTLKAGDGTRLEQIVHPLPFAAFSPSNNNNGARSKHVSLCLGEALSNADKDRAVPPILLNGKAPFTLEYAIKDNTGAIRKTLTKSDITTHTYSLQIHQSDFPFEKTGKWSVDLIKIVDGNGCERSLKSVEGLDSNLSTMKQQKSNMEIEVVESANISPVGTRLDYCVGETIDFVLQGSSPWTVTYNFEGKISRATVKSTTFSRIAEQPGILQVEAIAHQHNRCQTVVKEKVGMQKVIHALPSVHIREGTHYVEDLREGNQAEIIFKLDGEPPFSFTYQRTQAIDRFAKPEILETHTVTGIEDHLFTIQTAEEGTWSVIWLQDKWCAISIDMGIDGKRSKRIEGQSKKMIAHSSS